MKKSIFAIIVIIITILYVTIGMLIFSDIQIMKTPEITVRLDIIEINTDEAVLQSIIDINNPNSFQLSTKNFEAIIFTEEDIEVGHILIEGGDIPANKNKTFSEILTISFDNENIGELTTKITGTVGINFLGFIKKTLPISINVITSVEKIIEDLTPPVIHITADLSDISQEGINITSFVDIYNPNSFEIIVQDISINIETEEGENVGYLTLNGGTIKGKESLILDGSGKIVIEAINANTLKLNVTAIAGAEVAGLEKLISVSSDVDIIMPDLEDLLDPNKPTDIVMWWDYRFTVRGIEIDMTLEIINPHNISLLAEDIIVDLSWLKNGNEILIDAVELEGDLVPAKGSISLNGQMKLPYLTLFLPNKNKVASDWLVARARGNLTIAGLDQSVWIGFSECQDLHFLR